MRYEKLGKCYSPSCTEGNLCAVLHNKTCTAYSTGGSLQSCVLTVHFYWCGIMELL